LRSPSKIQKHGPLLRNIEKISSNKRHKDAKKDPTSKDFSIDSSKERTTTTSEGFSSDDTDSSDYNKKRKRHSKSSLNEEFRKEKPPTFDAEVKKGEEAEAWLLGLKKYL
jgi:hypothetical protein